MCDHRVHELTLCRSASCVCSRVMSSSIAERLDEPPKRDRAPALHTQAHSCMERHNTLTSLLPDARRPADGCGWRGGMQASLSLVGESCEVPADDQNHRVKDSFFVSHQIAGALAGRWRAASDDRHRQTDRHVCVPLLCACVAADGCNISSEHTHTYASKRVCVSLSV